MAGRIALLLGGAGVAYRAILLLLGTPWSSNSDEATMGLMALHISQGKAFPVYFYGQHYMGAIEAYLAAPLFWLAGPSTLALRLPNLLFYAAFLFLMWRLVAQLYTPWFATAMTGLFALCSDRIAYNQLVSGGGYPELVPVAAALMLIAAGRKPWYLLFGLLAGFLLWDDWLGLPYVAAAGVLMLVRHRLTIRRAAELAGGVVLGALPLIVHDLTARAGDRSWEVFGQLSNAGAGQAAGAGLGGHLEGGLLIGVPVATGVCPQYSCPPETYGWWGVLVPVLLLVSGCVAWRNKQWAQLALVIAGLVTIAWFVKSPSAVNTPRESARYLACLLVSMPAVLWPLWTGAFRSAASPGSRTRGGVNGLLRLAVLGAVALLSVAATYGAARKTAETRESDRALGRLVTALGERGITRIYTEYWTCNRLAFATRERIICATVAPDMGPAYDRVPGYRKTLEETRRPAYVFPENSREGEIFRSRAAGVPCTAVAGYLIYEPSAPLSVPRPA
ncbi:hypothetical protein [Longispora albida]|uniref:hypothetical protein n=1 Tax=Longispora albida TaxID=203523 RepID=UPI0012FA7269|nr:hypothetical protein [Longispora albida]